MSAATRAGINGISPTSEEIARYRTLGGATVLVTGRQDRAVSTTMERQDCTWSCLGCGDRYPGTWYESTIKSQANEHAGVCRSTAASADAASEIAALTEAVRGLAEEVRCQQPRRWWSKRGAR